MWTLMGTSSERNCSQHTWCYDAMSHICYKSRTAVQERARNRVALPVEVALKRFYLFQKLRYGLLKIWWFEKRGSRSVNLFHHFLFDQMHIVGTKRLLRSRKHGWDSRHQRFALILRKWCRKWAVHSLWKLCKNVSFFQHCERSEQYLFKFGAKNNIRIYSFLARKFKYPKVLKNETFEWFSNTVDG